MRGWFDSGPRWGGGVLLCVVASSAIAEPTRAQGAGRSTGGSAAPCAVPLAWTLTRVDAGFGIRHEEAIRAIERGAALWEAALGRTLFERTDDGFPVRLVFDDRQRAVQRRAARKEELDAEARRLDAATEGIEAHLAELDRARDAHDTRRRAHDERVEAHNATVRSWNERGGAPPDVATELERAGRALAEERAVLTELWNELKGRAERANARRFAINDDWRRLADQQEALETSEPPTSVEAGEYRETVEDHGRGRRVVVLREVRLYRFGDLDQLALLAAHELGHALGLGHEEDAGAVMSREHGAASGVRVSPAERARLLALCARVEG